MVENNNLDTTDEIEIKIFPSEIKSGKGLFEQVKAGSFNVYTSSAGIKAFDDAMKEALLSLSRQGILPIDSFKNGKENNK